MPGPWEKYGAKPPTPAGPWAKYAPPAATQEVNGAAKSSRELPIGEKVADLAKSLGVGVGKGVEALAGLPADLFNIGQLGASVLMGETAQDRAQHPERFNVGPTTANISATVNDLTRPEGGRAPLEYDPRSTAGDYAEKIGEYAPAVFAGPGGVARKVAMTVIPAVAGETARRAAEGTALEPYAEPVAALIAGGVTAGGKGGLVKEIASGAPERGAVKSATDAMYTKLRSAGITYDPMAYQNMAVNIMGKLKQGGFRKAQAPLTADALDAVAEQLQRGAPDYNDLESLRKTTGQILREKNATDTDKKAAGIVLDAIDNFMSNGKFSTNGTMTTAQAGPLMKEAREMARRNILAKQIDDMVEKAKTYQSGFESGLRNQFSSYLRSNKARGLTAEERQAFAAAAKGSWTNNALGSFGRLGIDFSALGNRATLLPGAAAGAGYAAGEPVTGAALVAAATAAKYAARQQTRNAARRALDTVLAGKGAQKNAALAQRGKQVEVNLRRLIAGENATAKDRSSPREITVYGSPDMVSVYDANGNLIRNPNHP